MFSTWKRMSSINYYGGCPMAKITLRYRVEVKREVSVQRRIQYTQPQIVYKPTPIVVPSSFVQKTLSDAKNEIVSTQHKLADISRRRTIPTGVYNKPIEDVYYALDNYRKPEEQETNTLYDVFISHASEDKTDFVNPLVEKLQDIGITVWYDTLEMQWGKGLREQIDNGIKRSKFAIVVLSKSFFKKYWTNRELDGILVKETVTGKTLLPIWYNITQEEVYDYSPTLSGVFAISSTTHTIDDICKAFQLILEKEAV
jgi:hypothetical protein